jgi:hypothetical protein
VWDTGSRAELVPGTVCPVTAPERRQLTADNGYDLEDWCGGVFSASTTVESQGIIPGALVTRSEQVELIPACLRVPTPVGVKCADLGDWVVRHEDGAFDVEPASTA